MTRHVWTIFLLLLCCCFATLQAEDVKVTMKSGSTITGELKELVATDHVTLIIAGMESVIPMNEVASIEKVSTSQTTPQVERSSMLVYGQYQITDTKDYPESFTLKIGDQELTMVLVRGGWFNMGYDGRHSLSYDSEPVHRVTLSSYYVSQQYLNCHTAEVLMKEKFSNGAKPYNCKYRKDAEELIAEINRLSGEPYRLLTEAEWEYAALMPFASTLFGPNKNVEWCSDFFENYSAADQINPQGPSSGKNHVLRAYSSDNEKWKRIHGSSPNAYVRIAISADQIQEPSQSSKSLAIPNSRQLYGMYEITDTKQYPDSICFKVGDQELTMVLVRGGWFNMGYDGKNSSAWNSEPVHKVNLSSYYICKDFISFSDAHSIINIKDSNGNPYPFVIRKDIDNFISALVKEVGMPLRMPTEAEWEYASLMPFAKDIFLFSNCYEWCSDYWGDYPEEEQTNPQGPSQGKACVLRYYSNDNKKWRRIRSANPSMASQTDLKGFLRLAISADEINK